MASANDTIILHDVENEMQPTLNKISNFLDTKGMSINGDKSKCISCVVRKKQLISRTEPFLIIGRKKIPDVSAISTFKYLGHSYSPYGMTKPSVVDLPKGLSNISRTALKPDQKLVLFKNHVIPK